MSNGYHQSAFVQKTYLDYGLAEGTAPDMRLRYGSKDFSPDRVRVTLRRSDSDPDWTVDHVKTNGPQRLKGGGLSEAVRFEYDWYSYDQPPEWLRPIIAEALATARLHSAEVSS